MQEIWIPLFLVTLFLFLRIIRPYSKKLRPISGLAWLPLLALLAATMLFPAYGFRPEIIPLLIYAAVLTGISLSKKARDDALYGSVRRTRFILAIPPLLLLVAAAGTAFYFTPQKDTSFITQGVYTLKAVSAPAGDDLGNVREKEYFIRVYTEENESRSSQRPLLVLMPPVFGSQAATDQVSAELRDRGFTVLSYSRRGFDSPALSFIGDSGFRRYGINPVQWFRRFTAYISGTRAASANAGGRALEEERKEDLLFLLSWIAQNPTLNETTRLFNVASRDAVFLAGYDAAGSAVILQGNSFSREGIQIRGLVAIESYLWSSYREEVPSIPILPPDAEWLTSVQHGLKRWFLEMKPKKITGLGHIPEVSSPILFLVSDRGRVPDGRYYAMFRTYEAAIGPAILISADGAGMFDYSDVPVKYPLVAAIFHGRERSAWGRTENPSITAEIISGFAASVLNAGGAGFRPGIMIAHNRAWPPAPRQTPNP